MDRLVSNRFVPLLKERNSENLVCVTQKKSNF